MRKHLILASFLGALLAAPLLHAQTPPADKGGGKGRMEMRDCKNAADPKACEDNRAKLRDAYKKAEDSCKGKAGPDHRACMRDQMCAQAKDPAQCKARVEKFAEKHKDVIKACEGKTGDELRKCVRDERAKERSEKK